LDPQAGIFYTLARDYLRINKIPLALENSKKAVELDPNDSEYGSLLAQIYTIGLMPDSAEAVYHKIISVDSNYNNAYYNLAKLYEENKPIRALAVYKKLLDRIGPSWEVLLNIANLNERLGNVNETIETIEELLIINPSSLELQKLLIESYLKIFENQKALKLINEALTLFPEDVNLIEFKGKALIQSGEWKSGSEEYITLIKDESIPFDSKLQIATVFFTQTLRDTSLIPVTKHLLETIEEDSSDWQINAYLGQLAGIEREDSIAAVYLKKAAHNATWNSELWVRLGGLLFDTGRYEDAAYEMEIAVKKFPDDFYINFILGLSLSQKNKHKKADQYLAKAVKLNPNDINASVAYGFTLNQLNKDDEAIIYLKRALKIDKNNIQALSILGLIYDSKQLWTESDLTYERAMLLDSTNVLIMNNFAYSLAERGKDLERALRMSQKAVDQEPENSSYLDTIGWIYYKIGEYEKAHEFIQKAIDFDENNATLLDHLGDVKFMQGERDNALELWQKAHNIDSTDTGIKN
jgi:tetratricopeptide (TPR) repeat protein